MGNTPELLTDKEVAMILALLNLLGKSSPPAPNEVQQAYQIALDAVAEARQSPGYPLPVGWKRPW